MRRRKTADYNALMKLEGWYQPTPSYRNMLDNIHQGCYVESLSTEQGGTVLGVLRNLDGIPVCIKVQCDDDGTWDYISADRVSFWEPYDRWVPDSDYESTFEEQVQSVLDAGYHWDNEREAYINEEGDEIIW